METKKKIIIADDSENVRNLTLNVLRRGFPETDIEVFRDGKSLLDRLEGDLTGVGVVISDNDMPREDGSYGISGSEIIRRLASKSGYEKVAFVLAYGGDESTGKQAVKNGARSYVLKPFDLTALVSTIRGYLEE